MLVIAGDHDLFIPFSRSERVAKRYGTRLMMAPGRGHMLVIEPGFAEICDWISDWIATTAVGSKHRGAA